jgi:hypothetical protein
MGYLSDRLSPNSVWAQALRRPPSGPVRRMAADDTRLGPMQQNMLPQQNMIPQTPQDDILLAAALGMHNRPPSGPERRMAAEDTRLGPVQQNMLGPDPLLEFYDTVGSIPGAMVDALGDAGTTGLQGYLDNLAVVDDPESTLYDRIDAGARVLLGGFDAAPIALGGAFVPPGAVGAYGGRPFRAALNVADDAARVADDLPVAEDVINNTSVARLLADERGSLDSGGGPRVPQNLDPAVRGIGDNGGPPPDPVPMEIGPSSTGGLTFALDGPKGAAARLERLDKRKRKELETGKLVGEPNNDRTVISAPRDSGLPDFVVGKVTFDDWVARVTSMLDPDEIKAASSWYGDIRDVFRTYFPDPAVADTHMRAWLVANQNIGVSGAMNNVLLQAEQFARGIPEDVMKAGGMPNPTYAIRRTLLDEPLEYGAAQKIGDFVDSAEGKSVRSWMADDIRGGRPFVVDIHTARDTGMVDQELINHLKRLGYDESQLDKIAPDFKDSIAETRYENRAEFGRSLTDNLNAQNWQGRSDWQPSEVQAVGWMSMTKLTAGQEETAVDALSHNFRRISAELAPGEGSPWESVFGGRLAALPYEEQASLTASMVDDAAIVAQEVSGINLGEIVHGTGGWMQFENPSAITQALATRQGAEIYANTLGYLLQQTEVWVNSIKSSTKNPKALALDLIAKGDALATDDGIRGIWNELLALDTTDLVQGYQPISTPEGLRGIRVIVNKGGAATRDKIFELIERARNATTFDDFVVNGYDADVTIARNNWKETPNGEAYLERLADLGAERPAAGWDNARSQLEETFERRLGEAEARGGGRAPAEGVIPQAVPGATLGFGQ